MSNTAGITEYAAMVLNLAEWVQGGVDFIFGMIVSTVRNGLTLLGGGDGQG